MIEPTVWLNGDLVPASQARVPAADLAILYGIGLFETLRSYGGRVFELDAHLQRLLGSATRLQLPVDAERLPDAGGVAAVLQANALGDARVRLTVTGGSPRDGRVVPTVLLTAVPFEPYPDGFYTAGTAAWVSPMLMDPDDPLAGHKVVSYWSKLQMLHQAQSHGCVEALWFNRRHELAEGSISNIFCVREGTVRTPPLDTPVLPGITRAVVMEICAAGGVPCAESRLVVDDLLDADEVFITNSMMEIVPVCRVERRAIGAERVGPLTQRLAAAYRTRVSEFR